MSDTLHMVRRLYDHGQRDFYLNVWRLRQHASSVYFIGDPHGSAALCEQTARGPFPGDYYVAYRVHVRLKVRP